MSQYSPFPKSTAAHPHYYGYSFTLQMPNKKLYQEDVYIIVTESNFELFVITHENGNEFRYIAKKCRRFDTAERNLLKMAEDRQRDIGIAKQQGLFAAIHLEEVQ